MSISKAAANAIANGTTIEVLQAEISDKHTKGLASEKSANANLSEALIYYRDCGKEIAKLKAECKEQGIDYLPELEEAGVKERTGQRYKQLAEHPRTKDVDVDFFKDMLSPTLTNVIKALPLPDDEWEKVISGEIRQIEIKKAPKTQQEKDNEKKEKAETAFNKYEYQNIDFEQFQAYYESSKESIIEILDKTISQTNVSPFLPLDTDDDVLEQEQVEEGVEV